MKPIDNREFRRRLRKFCLDHGWEFVEDPKRGKGDHKCYVLRHTDDKGRKTDEIPIVFDGGREDLPPGTRRAIIRFLRSLRDNIAKELGRQVVREFVEKLIEFLECL